VTKKLGEVCCIRKLQGAHHLPYVGLEDIESNTARFVGPTEPRIVKSLTFKFGARHVLYGRLRPYLNKAIVPNFTGHCSTEIFPLEPSSALSRYYLLYWLLFDPTMQSINSTCTGARMPRADMGAVLNFDLPLPPLPEQQRIVGILDAAFAAIATAKENAAQNLANAKELFASELNAIFIRKGEGWEEKRLGEVCKFFNGFAFKSPDAVAASNTQLVRMGNLYGNVLDLARSPVFYPDHFASMYSKYILKKGDIIISLTGTVGKQDYGYAVEIPDVKHSLLLNQRIAKISILPKANIVKKFALHCLRSSYFLSALYATANGTRQANLSTVTMSSLSFPFPSLPEQQRIVARLDALSARCKELEQAYIEKLALLDELKHSLLHQAFNGEL
jgi:Restriction endonuclease S subunits